MVNEIVSRFIASLCYSIDRTCRHDLQANRIVSERDYVSNLGTHLRFPLGPFCEFNLALATTLNGGLERIFGCDSILIFRHRNEVKIGIFEAKWPRFFTQQNYPWDSLSKKNNDSRFSSQIIRQQNWNASGLTIWEMFFNESLPGTNHVNWDDLGSTCVLHTDASNYFHTIMSGNQFQLWTNNDLNVLLKQSLNINQIVYRMLTCSYGQKFLLDNYSVTVKDISNDKTQIIPIPTRSEVQNNENRRFYAFMEEAGLSNYLFVDTIGLDQ